MSHDLAAMSWESSPEFSALSDEGRRKVRTRCIAVERILKAKPRGHAVAREAATLGLCGSAMRRLVTLYTRSGGDWRSQVDHRAEPNRECGLPSEFKAFVKDMCEKNQRGSRAAFRKLRSLYHSKAMTFQHSKDGEVIELWPGYVDERGFHYRPAPSPRTGLPRGWTHGNLYRHHPTKLERIQARLGEIAASEFAPMVFSTRRKIKPGQFYVFDDRWFDVESIIDSMNKPVRTIELSAGDVAAALTVSWDLFPLEEDDDGKREQIQGRHMLLLLAHLLCVVGFHRDGVTLLVELGTAAISHELECLLCTLSGGTVEEREVRDQKGRCTIQRVITKPGLIRVDRSGTKGGKAFGGGYPTLGKGNFRFKAGWESHHALKHTEMADLPGQVGRDSRWKPVEELHGRRAEAMKLMLAATEARPEVAAAIREGTGLMPFRQLYWAFDQVLKRIGDYTDHDLEGWREAGLEVAEYRLKKEDDAWLPMSELEGYPEAQRAAIMAYIGATDWCTRSRKLSRKEAWLRGANELTRLPMHCVPLILGPELSKLRKVNDRNFIQVDDRQIGDDTMFFSSVARTPENVMKALDPRVEYRTWLNPLCAKTLFVADTEGRYIGTCKFERIDRGDDAAAQREFVRVAAEHAELMREPLARARRRNRQITADRKKHIELFKGGPATEAERQLEADRKARAAAAQAEPLAPVAAPAASDDDEFPDFGSHVPIS
jgi:hypothetical protein